MSSFKIIKQDKKGNIEKAAIMNAVAFYTKFQQPSVIFDQKDVPKSQQTHFEWTVELVTDEDTADEYDETSPKQTSKKMTKAQLAKKFKLVDEDGNPDDEKFVEANLDPNQKKFFVIKKAQQCQKKDGTPLKQLQPRAVEIVDGKPVDITFEKLVGNGSKIDLMMRYTHNQSYGAFSYPAIMKVHKLVEYAGSGGGSGLSAEESDFLGGSVEFAEAPSEGSTGASQGSDDEPPFEPDEQPDFGEDDDELY